MQLAMGCLAISMFFSSKAGIFPMRGEGGRGNFEHKQILHKFQIFHFCAAYISAVGFPASIEIRQ
jgi:hypothetical protein